MDRSKNMDFIHKVEKMVSPEDVTAISFLGDFNKFLPKKAQHAIMEKGSKTIPYMGFIVDPYCIFIAYEIKNIENAKLMLPKGYELAETTIFNGGKKVPTLILSAFSARTSAFIGVRLEFYLIARNTETGMMSWIIADYETNTNSHDPKNGFCGYNSDPTTFATTPYGEVVTDFRDKKTGKEFSLYADINSGKFTDLDQELWVEGNLSIDYGGNLKDEDSKNFSLIFDPYLMKEALRIPLENVKINSNNFFGELIDTKSPIEVAIFPYSQHFVIKQDLKKGEIKNIDDLQSHIDEFLNRSNFKMMKGDDIKKPIFRSMTISTIVNLGLIIFLFIKAFLV